ncbi:hypothetical protein [Afipia broomeae]|uniref:Porin n=1 Tax=Afipia broomeae ATCC 49717 TaxID=883078 RepID=K8PPS2_9BRAD|nr:hypothetical protein [Afipia broomeae]EKS41520.1 hypothetical protein HMPREF9695_00612 [Afipia broomeae ATCC 49717]
MRHARHFILGFLAAGVLLVPVTAPSALAQQLDLKTQQPRLDNSKLKSVARPRPATSCAEYGAGYVRVEGTGSCVRLGGGINAGVGGSR